MNPAKSYAHLFSPLGGDAGDNYRAPGLITFLRSAHVPLNAEALKACGAKYAFVGVPFDEGNIGKPGSEDAPREFRLITQEYFSYWFEYNVDLHGKAVDCGDVSMPKVSPEVAHERIYRAVREVLKSGLIPIICGGDRSISITAARALSDHIGPQKKMGYEILPWLVETVQEVAPVPLSLDTTNLSAIEAALEVATVPCIINSTSAEEERLAKVPAVAKKFGAQLIALTMGAGGIPVSADERVNIALESLIPRAMELEMDLPDLLIDPLVLTVSGCQQYCPELIEAVRMLKFAGDPPPMVNVGLSNVSNQVPHPMRPLINNTYLVMLMAAGVDFAIANPMDEQLWEFMNIVDNRDDSTGKGRLLITLFDRTVAMEKIDRGDVDWNDPEQVAIFKTAQVLYNDVIYTDAYLDV